jgi:hypothetical protein
MAWVFDAPDFEYDDWSPYAVFEGDDVMVVWSEGDYFFALKADDAGDRWQPLPMQSDSPEDLERLRSVAGRLLDALGEYRHRPWRLADGVADRGSLAYEDDGFRAFRSSSGRGDPEYAGPYELSVREGDGWRRVDEYDTLWGLTQQIVSALLRLTEEGAGERGR